MSEAETCIIIGAGHAGSQCAISIRKDGWKGNILLLSNESALPYHRPPLSKAYLCEDPETLRLALRPESMYEKQNVQLLRDVEAQTIDPKSKSLELKNGEILRYTKLVLATGAKHRIPPIDGVDGKGIHFLRTLADARSLRSAIREGMMVAVIGAGYIGLEVAASLRKLGCKVKLLEMEDRIMARVTNPEMSDFFHNMHTQEGVEIHTGIRVEQIEDSENGKRLTTSEGGIIEADLIIMGTGALPNTGLAKQAGLNIGDGIEVSETCQTSDPDIYAIGDCTSQYHPRYNQSIRLESVQNALDQAKTAAAAINGKDIPPRPIPWFWSDQYNVKLQITGLSRNHTSSVVRGNIDDRRSFSVWYFKESELIAVDVVNDTASYVAGSKFIAGQRPVSPEDISNLDIDLKTK